MQPNPPARRDLLAAAIMDALAGQRDPWVYARAQALGWAEFPQAVQQVVDVARHVLGERPMSQAMALMTSQQHVEWYTPPWVTDLARAVLGGIDLDPASNPTANGWIGAARIYTKDDDGYMQPWAGRVYLNPPFDDTARWARRLAAAYQDGDVTAAILLVNSAPGYNWYEALADVWPAVQLRKRLQFVRGDGQTNKDKTGNAKKSQTLFYFGPDAASFYAAFEPHGRRLHTAQAQPRKLFEEAA